MDTEECMVRIKKELRRDILRAEKTREQIMEELGLSVNYLDTAWRRGNLKIRTLLEVLEAAGVHPSEFFHRALKPDDDFTAGSGEAIENEMVRRAYERFYGAQGE